MYRAVSGGYVGGIARVKGEVTSLPACRLNRDQPVQVKTRGAKRRARRRAQRANECRQRSFKSFQQTDDWRELHRGRAEQHRRQAQISPVLGSFITTIPLYLITFAGFTLHV